MSESKSSAPGLSILLSAAILAGIMGWTGRGIAERNDAAQNQGECTEAPVRSEPITAGGTGMGTFYSLKVNGEYPGGQEALARDAEQTIRRIEKEISTFDRTSELSKFNSYQGTGRFEVSRDTAIMVAETMRLGKSIGGATDITVFPLVDLWGFGPDKKPEGFVPDDASIEKAKALLGLDRLHVIMDAGRYYLQKDFPELHVDLSTVGEGYGADRFAELMDRKGVKNYLVQIAGASRSRGISPSGRPWRIAINGPQRGEDVAMETIVPQEMAVSTAGSYRNYFEKDGKRFSHAIDPVTGRPIEHRTVSVTVIAPTGLETDALDTGLLVLGADRALEYAEKAGLPIYCIVKDESGKFVSRYSSAFAKYLAD